jgi:hypothetical protein
MLDAAPGQESPRLDRCCSITAFDTAEQSPMAMTVSSRSGLARLSRDAARVSEVSADLRPIRQRAG